MRGIWDHIGVYRHMCKDRRRKICIYKIYERYMGAYGCRDICMYIDVLQRLVFGAGARVSYNTHMCIFELTRIFEFCRV